MVVRYPRSARTRARALGMHIRHNVGHLALAPPVLLTLLAAALRFPTLGLQSFWFDEVVTVRLVELPFVEMLQRVADWESTPPTYYAVAWIWAQAFGTDEVGLRSLSALVGTATIPIVYAVGRQLVSRRVGVFAAGLTAVSPLMIWYSQEARAYAFLILLSSASLLVFARALDRPSARRLAAWASVGALAVATHYFAVFLIAVEGAALLALAAGARRRVLGAGATVVAASLPLVPLLLRQRENNLASWIADEPFPIRLFQVVQQFLVGDLRVVVPLLVAGYLFMVVLAAGAWFAGRRGRRAALLCGCIGLAAMGLPLAATVGGNDFFYFRNLVGAWPAFALGLACLLGTSRAPRVGLISFAAIAVFALLTIGLLTTDPDARRPDWRHFSEAIGEARPNRIVVVTPAYEAWALAHYRTGMRGTRQRVYQADEIAVVGQSGLQAYHARDFDDVSVRDVRRLAVIRYRAETPRAVDRDVLRRLVPAGQTFVVLVEGG